MQPFIVIRSYREDDELKCQELVRDYIMSFAKKSFLWLCFRGITLQFIVITWAILFIFLGVPLTLCSLTIPGCIFFLFSGTYFSFYVKALELMRIIACVSVKNHKDIYNAGWMYRFALAPGYPLQQIAQPMMVIVSCICEQQGYGSLECTMSEWQEEERDFCNRIGFSTRQIYHKQIIGFMFTVMKTQLTFNLKPKFIN
ncbi:uncharacterized protein ACRADG_002290 isoform 2-T2 [Cochliomyia hominivorax]